MPPPAEAIYQNQGKLEPEGSRIIDKDSTTWIDGITIDQSEAMELNVGVITGNVQNAARPIAVNCDVGLAVAVDVAIDHGISMQGQFALRGLERPASEVAIERDGVAVIGMEIDLVDSLAQ